MKEKIPSPSESIAYETRGTFRAFENLMQRALREKNVRYSHFHVLHVLWEKDGVTQNHIARETFTTESSNAQVIAEMLAEGLIERKRDSNDARKRIIFLTSKGKKQRDLLSDAVLHTKHVAQTGLSQSEIAAYLKTSKTIRESLTAEFKKLYSESGRKMDTLHASGAIDKTDTSGAL